MRWCTPVVVGTVPRARVGPQFLPALRGSIARIPGSIGLEAQRTLVGARAGNLSRHVYCTYILPILIEAAEKQLSTNAKLYTLRHKHHCRFIAVCKLAFTLG
jgi:hypothetical protein